MKNKFPRKSEQRKLKKNEGLLSEILTQQSPLDNLVSQIPSSMMRWSLLDIYLMTRALETTSISRALEIGKKFHFTPSRRHLLDMNHLMMEQFGGMKLFDDTRHGFIILTEAGKAFTAQMNLALKTMCESLHNVRTESGKRIKVAATQFMMIPVTGFLHEWKLNLESGSEIDVEQIRTAELETKLLSRQADLVFSACIVRNDGTKEINQELEFQPVKQLEENIGILTNIPNLKINDAAAFKSLLKSAYFALPERGLIHEFTRELCEKYPELETSQIKWVKDVLIGIVTLQSGYVHEGRSRGCMFMLEGAAEWTERLWIGDDGAKLSFVSLPNGIFEKKIQIGVFRRKDDSSFDKTHPLQKCWQLFQENYNKAKPK